MERAINGVPSSKEVIGLELHNQYGAIFAIVVSEMSWTLALVPTSSKSAFVLRSYKTRRQGRTLR